MPLYARRSYLAARKSARLPIAKLPQGKLRSVDDILAEGYTTAPVRATMNDTYQVLPHRDVAVNHAFAGAPAKYTHRPCGMPLSEGDVKDANWCPHCAVTINKAAQRRGQAEWS